MELIEKYTINSKATAEYYTAGRKKINLKTMNKEVKSLRHNA